MTSLRALEPDDLEFLFQLENDPSIWGVSDTLAPVSRQVLREYLEHATAELYVVRQLRLVVTTENDGRPVGIVDLVEWDPLPQLFATVGADNRPSLRLFRAAVFRRVGRRQQWLRQAEGWEDAVEFQCLLA